MTTKTLEITPSDIELFYHISRQAFLDTPANTKLPGQSCEMSEREFRAMANIKGVLAVLVRHGVVDAETDLVIDHSNS